LLRPFLSGGCARTAVPHRRRASSPAPAKIQLPYVSTPT
jgi:hypothetical protein